MVGVCGAMEQKSGLGDSGKKSRRSKETEMHLLLTSARGICFMALRQFDPVYAMGDVDQQKDCRVS